MLKGRHSWGEKQGRKTDNWKNRRMKEQKNGKMDLFCDPTWGKNWRMKNERKEKCNNEKKWRILWHFYLLESRVRWARMSCWKFRQTERWAADSPAAQLTWRAAQFTRIPAGRNVTKILHFFHCSVFLFFHFSFFSFFLMLGLNNSSVLPIFSPVGF